MAVNLLSNLDRARLAWGANLPAWVGLLASACDTSNQRVVAERIGKSGGYISRVLNCKYAGSYEEAEKIVRAAYGKEDVVCPLWGSIPLSSCIRARRRKGAPQNQAHLAHARACPTCPNNSDRREED